MMINAKLQSSWRELWEEQMEIQFSRHLHLASYIHEKNRKISRIFLRIFGLSYHEIKKKKFLIISIVPIQFRFDHSR